MIPNRPVPHVPTVERVNDLQVEHQLGGARSKEGNVSYSKSLLRILPCHDLNHLCRNKQRTFLSEVEADFAWDLINYNGRAPLMPTARAFLALFTHDKKEVEQFFRCHDRYYNDPELPDFFNNSAEYFQRWNAEQIGHFVQLLIVAELGDILRKLSSNGNASLTPQAHEFLDALYCIDQENFDALSRITFLGYYDHFKAEIQDLMCSSGITGDLISALGEQYDIKPDVLYSALKAGGRNGLDYVIALIASENQGHIKDTIPAEHTYSMKQYEQDVHDAYAVRAVLEKLVGDQYGQPLASLGNEAFNQLDITALLLAQHRDGRPMFYPEMCGAEFADQWNSMRCFYDERANASQEVRALTVF